MNKTIATIATALLLTSSHSFAHKSTDHTCTSETTLWLNHEAWDFSCGSIRGSLPTIINPDLQKEFMKQLNDVLVKSELFYGFGPLGLCASNAEHICQRVKLLKDQTLHIDFDTEVLQVSDDLVSIRVNIPYNFYPSAHPSETGFIFNFNPKTGRVINGLDGINSKDREELIKQVVNTLGERGINTEDLEDTVEKLLPGHVGFTSREAIFVFWRYEIAAGSYGTQVVSVPFIHNVKTNG